MPRPITSQSLLGHYRKLLVIGGLAQAEAARQTLPGLRVFMADQAYKAGVSRDQRRYIGRWANESMADTYTRDHRRVITNIWTEVMKQEERSGKEYIPEDLDHPYYADAQGWEMLEDTGAVDGPGFPPPGSEG